MCGTRIEHIKKLALLAIAEETLGIEHEDVVIPAEEPKEPKVTKAPPPKYIGERTEIETTPAGEKYRVYEGGGVQVRTCPVCGFQNAIFNTKCENCQVLHKKMSSIAKKAEKMTPTLKMDDRSQRLALWSSVSPHLVGLYNPRDKARASNYGAETLDTIWNSQGVTLLGPDTIEEVVPTNTNKLEKAVFEMNTKRDEHGDIIINPTTNMPELSGTFNWIPLKNVLERLSVYDTGNDEHIMKMDEFYEQVKSFNESNPDKIVGHIDIGAPYDKLVQKDDIMPEFQGKTEVGTGAKAVIRETVPDSSAAGYFSLWPWNNYKTPSGKERSGLSVVFAERLAQLTHVQLISMKRKLERTIAKYKEEASINMAHADAENDAIKQKKVWQTLLTLRNTDLDQLEQSPEIIERLKKSREHLEKVHGKELDEALARLSEYLNKTKDLMSKVQTTEGKLQELLVDYSTSQFGK